MKILGEVHTDLAGIPELEALRAIRDMFDDAAFLPELRDYIGDNRASLETVDILNRITRILRDIEEIRDRRELHRTLITNSAVGGGTGLMVSSIVSTLAQGMQAVTLLPILAGVWLVSVAFVAAGLLDRERSVYKQVADRLPIILKALE